QALRRRAIRNSRCPPHCLAFPRCRCRCSRSTACRLACRSWASPTRMPAPSRRPRGSWIILGALRGDSGESDTYLMDDRLQYPPALDRYRDDRRKHERCYPDLHEHVLALARAGLLVVVDEPINKDTEMHPLVRWQFRGGIPEQERKAFLFPQPTDPKGRRFAASVLVAGLAANREVYRIGFGKPLDAIGQTWLDAMAAPIKPRIVDDAPCHDVVVTGRDLDRDGQAL